MPPLTVLPPLSLPAGVAARPSCKVTLDLRDTGGASRPVAPLPEYDVGLLALSNDEPLEALKHLRKVVEQDEPSDHGSAAVLACLLSLQLGDRESFRALRDVCLSNERPDDYAAHLVSTSRLSISALDGDDASSIVLTECLQMPAIAVQLATIGSLMQGERLSEAAELLETIAEQIPDSQLVVSAAQQVHFGDTLAAVRTPLCFPVGVDADGEPLTCDLVQAAHLLIAGSNGAEKTSFLHSMICSLLMTTTPDDLLLHLTATKSAEFTIYDGIPNLICDTITDSYSAINNFHALVGIMETRYKMAQEYGAKSLDELNSKLPIKERLPYLLIVVDEMVDLVAVDQKAFQKAITSITQRAQAVGMHLVLATQFPRGDVCTSSIKRSLPSRIAFLTTSRAESRIIVDTTGAQDLFGNGDCLYVHEQRTPIWAQSPYVTSAEVAAIVGHLKAQAQRPTEIA